MRTILTRKAPAGRFGRAVGMGSIFALILTACSVTVGSRNPTSEARTTADFDRVEMTNSVDLEVEVGPDHSVVVEGDDNIVGFIKTTVDGGKLSVWTESGRRFTTSKPVVVRVTAPEVNELDVTGSGTARIRGADSDGLNLILSGSGTLEAQGRASQLTVDVSGSGTLDAALLTADDVKVDLSGSGSVQVATNGDLFADISGSGSVEYIGSPTVSADISGSGSISQGS